MINKNVRQNVFYSQFLMQNLPNLAQTWILHQLKVNIDIRLRCLIWETIINLFLGPLIPLFWTLVMSVLGFKAIGDPWWDTCFPVDSKYINLYISQRQTYFCMFVYCFSSILLMSIPICTHFSASQICL